MKYSRNSDYFQLLCDEIVNDLIANLRIKKFTNNSALIGSFAEESIKELIKTIVYPLRISTGSIISKDLLNSEKKLPQIDCIIWDSTPFPAIFSKGNFGLIPKTNVMGIIEIKSSNYSDTGKKIKHILNMESKLIEGYQSLKNGNIIEDNYPKSIGIICVYNKNKTDTLLEKLISSKNVITILEHSGDNVLKPSRKGILSLIDFLSKVKMRANKISGYRSIDLDYIENS